MVGVTAKFRVIDKAPKTDDDEVHVLKLEAVVGGNPENDAFFKYTPSGQITFGTVNGAAADYFEVGAEYYVNFQRANPTAIDEG